MKYYAKVIISEKTRNLDRFFTYEIPEKLKDKLKIGHRVLVPFGFRNKPIQAFIFELFYDQITDYKVKKVKEALDKEPILSLNTLDMIKWMKEKYFSTYYNLINLFIPKGINFKNFKMVKLNQNLKNDITINDEEKSFIDFFNEIKIIEYNKLIKEYEIKENLLKKLEKKQLIEIFWDYKSNKNILTDEILFLNKDMDYSLEYLFDNKILEKRSFRQVEIIKFLKNNKEVYKRDLKDILGVDNSSIDALKRKNLIKSKLKEIYRQKDYKTYKEEIVLNKEQIKAIKKLKEMKNENIFKEAMLFGVTGSGKTKVYIEIAKEYIKQGKQVLILVPEISLTPQTMIKFKNEFFKNLVLIHSKLSTGERYDAYRRVKENDAKIIIGVRSALFCDFYDLGLIVIDEFHEDSYKSDKEPRYDTIDVAKQISKVNNALLIFGSATPSVKLYYEFIKEKKDILRLEKRANNNYLPKIDIVDMKEELKKGNKSFFSYNLIDQIKQKIKKKEQIILFLNRKGYSSFINCTNCGYVFKCEYCDVSLTYYKKQNILKCNYCGYKKEIPKICPECNAKNIDKIGIGTEQIESKLKELIEDIKILRLDKSSVSKKNSLEEIIEDFKNKKADVLIGTQMVTKGLDFSNVTLVGIICADMSLNFPDYKSSERTFQLISQVSGRAGRGEIEGNVILQTFNKDHYSIKYAVNHDFLGFYNEEIKIRRLFSYSPFNNIIRILISGDNEKLVIKTSNKIYEAIFYILNKKDYNNVKGIFLPNPCLISKVKNKYRWQIIIKDEEIKLENLKKLVKYICIDKSEKLFDKNINISIDINPSSLI